MRASARSCSRRQSCSALLILCRSRSRRRSALPMPGASRRAIAQPSSLPDGRTIEARVRAVTPTLNGETRSARPLCSTRADRRCSPASRCRCDCAAAARADRLPSSCRRRRCSPWTGRDVVFVRTRGASMRCPVTDGPAQRGADRDRRRACRRARRSRPPTPSCSRPSSARAGGSKNDRRSHGAFASAPAGRCSCSSSSSPASACWQLTRLPIDAVPDITNKQVQINTIGAGLSPIEIERQVTFPIETALAGIPGLESTRSLSRNGFQPGHGDLHDDVDRYLFRAPAGHRAAGRRRARACPTGVEPQMGPITTGLGEVLMWTVEFAHPGRRRAQRARRPAGWQRDGSFLTPEGERLTTSVAQAAYLRTVQDWIIRAAAAHRAGRRRRRLDRRLREAVSWSSPIRRSSRPTASPSPSWPRRWKRPTSRSAPTIVERGGEAYLVRADARIRTLDEICRRGRRHARRRAGHGADVATVRIGGELRTGAASRERRTRSSSAPR